MIPLQSGPITPPASAEAPISPIGMPRRPAGNRSPAMAIAIGTRAPAPTAWNTLAPMSHDKVGVSATATDPTMNNAMDAKKSRRWPQTSDTLPNERHRCQVAQQVAGDRPRGPVQLGRKELHVLDDLREDCHDDRLVVCGDEYAYAHGDQSDIGRNSHLDSHADEGGSRY